MPKSRIVYIYLSSLGDSLRPFLPTKRLENRAGALRLPRFAAIDGMVAAGGRIHMLGLTAGCASSLRFAGRYGLLLGFWHTGLIVGALGSGRWVLSGCQEGIDLMAGHQRSLPLTDTRFGSQLRCASFSFDPKVLRTACLLLGLLASSSDPAAAQEWVRFRGPNGTGISDATTIPTEWTEADYNWRVALPGIGHSSPVSWGNRIFLTSADNENAARIVLCLAAEDGRTLWSRQYASAVHTKHQLNSFASPTPAVDDEHVYVVWSAPEEYSVRAFNHAGNEVWHRSLGPYASQHSCGTSPIVYENLVILGNEQDGVSSLVALDCATGEVAWQTPRKTREVSYSTPCVYQPAGGPVQLLFNSGAHGIAGVNPSNGQPYWELDVFDKRSCSSPIIAGDLIVGSCGSGGGGNYVVAVRPGKADGSQPAEVAYKITKSAPYVPTGIYKDGLLFLWSDQGVATGVEAETGKILWQNRVGGKFFGSPICVANRLIAMSDAGEAVVLAAAPEYKLLARNPLGEGSHSTPAVAGGVLYLRTFSHLVSIGGKK